LVLIWEQFGSDPNALGTCRVMKGREVSEFLDSPQNALGDENRAAKIFSTVNDAMSDRFDFQLFFATKKFNDPKQCSVMIRASHFFTVTETFQVGHLQAGAMGY
jgi:hypothetical protein